MNKVPVKFIPTLDILGVNPFVFVPDKILKEIFKQAGKSKGPIPVKGTVNGKAYKQTLVRYRGHWRLYINMQMLKNSPKRVGEKLKITIVYDPIERVIPMHPALQKALKQNPQAKKVFDGLTPSRRKEIVRYIYFLKTEEAIKKNVSRAIKFLGGSDRFVGKDKSK